MNVSKPILFCTSLCMSLAATAQVTMTIDAQKRAAAISEHQYGLFFEEINHAGDGGLYAELIRNRSFEDNNTIPECWSAILQNGQDVILTLNTKQVMNKAQQTCLQLSVSGASATQKAGVCNTGFWGMHFETDSTYTLRVWVKASAKFNGKIYGQLQQNDGTAVSGEVQLEGSLKSDSWTLLTARIKANASCEKGRFALLTSDNGSMLIDVVSLMPYT